MPNKINKNLYQNITTFHSENLFIPKRIIYFGSNNVNGSDGDSPDEVNPYNVGQLIKNLLVLDYQNHQLITLYLNTSGGSWEDGMSLYDTIKSLNSRVNIIGLGKIYSMGSIIIQSGFKRFLTQNTLFLIHDGAEGFAGDSKSYEAWAKISKENRCLHCVIVECNDAITPVLLFFNIANTLSSISLNPQNCVDTSACIL